MDGITTGKIERSVAEALSHPRSLRSDAGDLTVKAGLAPTAGAVRDLSRVPRSQRPTAADSRRESAGSREELQALTDNLNRVFENSTGIRFDLSEDSGELVVQVIDLQSEEVIRTIPSERIANLRRQFSEFGETGVLLDRTA
ncbi:MAG: flagellar protein FlaG [Planctomycetes bacterium]|nr:flagellar protein FlaG [Planctomycetota bacterium]